MYFGFLQLGGNRVTKKIKSSQFNSVIINLFSKVGLFS